MSKFKATILIIGILVMCAAASLITYLVLSFSGAIVTDPVELVFKVADNEKAFDGAPLRANAYELVSGELTEGHRAVVEYTGAQTEVGESKSGMTVKIFDENDFEVTKEYAIKVNGGHLTVEKCEVYIRLNEKEVLYNGEKVLFDDYTVTTGRLANGHRAGAAKKDAGIISVNDILTESEVAPAIYDENGKDVSENYDIHFRMESVRVTARPLEIKPVSAEKVYDGELFLSNSYLVTSGSLVSGHYAQVTYVNEEGEEAQFLDVGELEVFASAVIYNERGEDVTENYALPSRSESAMLKITPRNVVLTALSNSWEYDGEEHSLESETEAYSAEGIVSRQTVAVTYSGAITDAGTAENEIEEFEISGGNGNYNVTCVSGTLTVTKKKVTVQMQSGNKTYDGQPLTLADAQYDSNGTSLTILESNLTGIKNAGEYTFTARFDDHGGNYDITVLPATYVISPIELNMNYTGSTQKIYDGTAFEVDCSQIELSGGNTTDFEVVSVTYDRVVFVACDDEVDEETGETVRKIKTTPLNLRYPRIVLKSTGEEAAAGNFKINIEEVNVTIVRRALTIKPVNLTVNEDTELGPIISNMKSAGDFISPSTPLASGDYASNLFNFSAYRESGMTYVSLNTTNGAIYNSQGENVTDCYYFTRSNAIGLLTVIPSETTTE